MPRLWYRRGRREASSTVPSTALCSLRRDAFNPHSRRGYRPAKMLDHWWGVPPGFFDDWGVESGTPHRRYSAAADSGDAWM